MKRTFALLVLSTSLITLSGCGGGDLLDAEPDTNHLIPEPDTSVPDDRLRPPADAPTLTTATDQILDVDGMPVVLRGINQLYGDDPLTRINGIEPIRDTGANVVRVILNTDTTLDEVEAVLTKALEQGVIALLTLDDDALRCTPNDTALLSAVDNLWLDEWLPALGQRRFQDHLMINIANKWGPMGVFDAYSLGYDGYIDTYKVAIRKFRELGFKVPLVIDAPNCGQDVYAFLGARGRELMAADDIDTLVLSLHAEGARWNSNSEIIRAMNLLKEEGVPVVFTDFRGSGIGGEELAIDHNELMRIANGEHALTFNLPWSQTDDKAAYVNTLDQSYNLNNATISVDVFVDRDYADDGQLALVMYLKDTSWRYANLGWNQTDTLTGNSWNRIRVSLTDVNSIPGFVSDGFDLSVVNQIGFELVANGKPAEIAAPILFDNLTITQGEVVGPMYDEDFNSDTGGWGGGWGTATLAQSGSDLAITPDWTAGDNFAKTLTGAGVIDFNEELTFTLRVYLPAEYTDESGLYFKFFGQFGPDWTWYETPNLYYADFTPGAWNDVVIQNNFATAGADTTLVQAFGMQWGGVSTAKTESILIDSITITGPAPELPPEIQFQATFDSDVESWGNTGWGTGGTIMQADGALSVTPDWTGGDNIALQRSSIATVDTIDFTDDPIVLRARVFLPANYAGTDFWFKFFMQDGDDWTWYETATLSMADFTAGDWSQLEFDLSSLPADFATNLRPNNLGVQFGGVTVDGAVLFDDIEIVGVGDLSEETLLSIDFEEQAEAEAFNFDFGEGSLDATTTVDARTWDYGTKPFGWVAWSWTGNSGDNAALNISDAEDMPVLTERGEDIVNGTYGLQMTAEEVNFLPVEEQEAR